MMSSSVMASHMYQLHPFSRMLVTEKSTTFWKANSTADVSFIYHTTAVAVKVLFTEKLHVLQKVNLQKISKW